MKKQLLFIATLLTVFAMQTHAQHGRLWDFTKELSWETINLLDNDATNWTPSDDGSRWTNATNNVFCNWGEWEGMLATFSNEDGNSAHFLQDFISDGFPITFSMGSATNKSNNIQLFRSGKIRLTRNGMLFTIPEVYDGQTITIMGKSANATATNRGLEPVQNFVTLVNGITTNGQCIFLGDQVEGVENTRSFTFKVESGSENPVDVQFRIITGGIELLSVAVNSADVDIENVREFTYHGVAYYVMDDGNAQVTYAIGDNTNMVIPEYVTNPMNGKTYHVTQLSANAFNAFNDYFTVTLPESITEIPDAAFKDNQWLQFINLPRTLMRIGEAAFKNCKGLQNISLYSMECELTVGGYAFQNCTSLKTAWIDGNIKEIPRSMFRDCTSLVDIHLSDSLTRIREAAFSGASSLKSVVLPDHVLKLHAWAFNNCSSLKTIVALGNSPATVENEALKDIDSDVMLIVPEGATEAYQQKDGWNTIGNVREILLPNQGTPIYLQNVATSQYLSYDNNRNCLLGGNGTVIEWMGTWNGLGNHNTNYSLIFSDLTQKMDENQIIYYSLGINGSDTNIQGTPAASYWTVLKGDKDGTIRLLYNVSDSDNTQYSYLTADSNNSSAVNAYGVEDDWSLWRIVNPDDVVPVNDIFTAQTEEGINMQFRVVDEDTKTCEVYAAPYESGGTFRPAVKKGTTGKVTVPAEANGYRVIGLSSWCFYSCASISEMVLPETVGYIGESAFRMATGLQYINIPEGIGTIGERTFSGCTQLRTIKLPEGLTTLGPAAFANNYLLETVTLPSTLTSIARTAFQNSRLLQSVTAKMEEPIELPDKNFTLSVNPVLYVPMISKAAYEASATWSQLFTGGIVGYYRTGDVFKATTPQGVEMQFRVLDEDEKTCEVYTEPYEEGKSFSPAINKDFQGELVIPEEIEGFRVTAIGSWSFRSCKGITTATLPATITRIEGSVFRSCDNLASVNIPEGVTFIGESAFMGCPINIISLPSTLKEMEMYAFRNKNEESATSYVIAYMPEPCKAHRLALGGNIKSSTLYVPVGTKEAYAAAECFQYFKKILEIGETDEETATTDVVYAPTVSIKAGEQAKLTLKLNTSVGYQGYQMRLMLPEGLQIATDDDGCCLLEKAIDDSGLMLQAAKQGDGSYIIIAFNMGGKAAVNVGDADLLSMTLVANESLAAGEYSGRIEEIVLATGNGSATPANATFAISVEAKEVTEQGIVTAEDVETESGKEVTLPIFLNNQSAITAFYFDLTLPKGITVAESEGQLKAELVGEYANETVLLMGTPLSGNTYRFIATPLTDDGTFKANAGHVMNVTISVGEMLSSGVYTAKLEVVKLVAIETAGSPAWRAAENLSNLTSFATITVKGNKAIMGDVNADMAVDVEDVVGIVNKILGEPAANFNPATADLNGDGKIDVDDVVAVVNIILEANSSNARKQE